MNHKKAIIDIINKLSYRHSNWQVFSDFIEVSAISLSNAVDCTNLEGREKRYLDIISSYSNEEIELFPKAFSELVMTLENEPTDILGEIFMELNLGSKWKGQFFTPMSVCKAMAAMTIADNKNLKKIIKENGHFTILEPTCGGGALIIALALEIEKMGWNYQECMKVTAVDLDLKAVYMCYIQLSLLGIPAIVLHGNSLTQETFSTWKTPMYIMNRWRTHKPTEIINLKVDNDGQMQLVI